MKPWTEKDLQILRSHYPKMGKRATAELLNRTIATVRSKASQLGLTLDRDGPFWKDFQARAAKSKLGKKLSADHVAKAIAGKKASQKPRKEIVWTPQMRARRSEHSKVLWAQQRQKMLTACLKGWSGNEARRMKTAQFSKEWWEKNKDRFMTEERRQTISDQFSKAASKRQPKNAFSDCRQGNREDLGMFFRSSWEANYARYLNFLVAQGEIQSWKYEPKTFWFEKIMRGVRSYKPDFLIITKAGREEYHEVKGWMRPESKTAIGRMKRYYPEVTLIVIDQVRYRGIERSVSHIIKNWERRVAKRTIEQVL